MNKTCTKCKHSKPVESFHKNKSSKDGYHCYCKECNNSKLVKWRADNKNHFFLQEKSYQKKNPDKFKLKWRRGNIKRYGITLEDYEHLKQLQQGTCAICHTKELNGKPLSIDHNHTTGQIRKLLCQRCNRGLGMFRENPKLLINASFYLQEHLTTPSAVKE